MIFAANMNTIIMEAIKVQLIFRRNNKIILGYEEFTNVLVLIIRL